MVGARRCRPFGLNVTPDLAEDTCALWLQAFQRAMARASHDVKDALNGVSVNIEVIRSRAARADARASAVAQFGEAAGHQLERLTTLLEAILSSTTNRKENKTVPSSLIDNKLYDLTMIRSVSGGNSAFIKKMIALFIETVPPNVQELVDATSNKNWEQVAKMAHKLKSTIDSMGIRTIHDQIRSVEMNAKNQRDLIRMPDMVRQVESVVAVCVQQLHREVGH